MILKELEKDKVTIWLDKKRELSMSLKEWKELEEMIVFNYKKEPLIIKDPIKGWSP